MRKNCQQITSPLCTNKSHLWKACVAFNLCLHVIQLQFCVNVNTKHFMSMEVNKYDISTQLLLKRNESFIFFLFCDLRVLAFSLLRFWKTSIRLQFFFLYLWSPLTMNEQDALICIPLQHANKHPHRQWKDNIYIAGLTWLQWNITLIKCNPVCSCDHMVVQRAIGMS